SYSPARSGGFHEGTAWQYQWLAHQDAPGLVSLLGGKTEAIRRLDDFFALDAILEDPARAVREQWVVGPYSYYNQFRYNPINAPGADPTELQYVRDLKVDGEPHGEPWIDHAALRAGVILDVELTSDSDSATWGMAL